MNTEHNQILYFPHQEKNIKLMQQLEQDRGFSMGVETSFGVLADAPGFGKSFAIIGLIERSKLEPFSKDVKHYVSNYFATFSTVLVHPTTVIFCSANIVHQWEQYFNNSFVSFQTISTPKSLQTIDLENTVFIVSHHRWAEFCSFSIRNDVTWLRCVFDDFDSQYVPGFVIPSAHFYWFLTASPNALFKSKCGKRQLSDFFHGNEFNRHVIIKNSIDDLRESTSQRAFDVKEVVHFYKESPLVNAISTFAPAISEFIRAGDFSGAITALGGKSSNLCDAISQKFSSQISEQKRLLTVVRDKDKKEKHNIELARLEKLQLEWNAECHSIIAGDCPICAATLENPVMVNCCFNFFCAACIVRIKYAQNKCPMCRNENFSKKMVVIGDTTTPKQKTELPTKMRLVVSLAASPGKHIIVSDCIESFNIPNAIKLVGRECTRKNKIKRFSDASSAVLILNSKENAAGINLPSATSIIFYHDLDNAREQQIFGRIMRIGRVNETIFVHRFEGKM